MLRSLVKTAAANALHWSGIARLFAKNAPLVLSYHRVVEDFSANARDSMPPMLISAKMLERQIDWIGRRYQFVSLDELGSYLQGERSFPKPVAAVSFDDGYEDTYEHGLPLLHRKGIPSAVFVVTDLVGTSKLQYHDWLYLLLRRAFAQRAPRQDELFAFLREFGVRPPEGTKSGNDLVDFSKAVNFILAVLPQSEVCRVIETLEKTHNLAPSPAQSHRALTWDRLREMQQAGVIIGSHTRSHAVLTAEDAEKVYEEIEGSRKELEKKLGSPVRHFAYPDGRFNRMTIKAVAASGYGFAYTTSPRPDADYPLLTIPRRVLWERSCIDALGQFSPALLDCLISGVFDFGDYGAGGGLGQDFRHGYAVDL